MLYAARQGQAFLTESRVDSRSSHRRRRGPTTRTGDDPLRHRAGDQRSGYPRRVPRGDRQMEPPRAGDRRALSRAEEPAAARNEGAREATGEVLVFVDADVAVHDDALGRIPDAFDGDTRCRALRLLRRLPPEPDAVSGFRNLLHHHVHQQGGGDAKTFWAGLGAIRRSVFVARAGSRAVRWRTSSSACGCTRRARGSGSTRPSRARTLNAWGLGA